MTKKKSKSEIDEKIEELAIAVADDAMGAEGNPLLRLDALKALTTYRVGAHKTNKDQEPEEEKTGTMGAMKRRIQEADGPSNVITIPKKD